MTTKGWCSILPKDNVYDSYNDILTVQEEEEVVTSSPGSENELPYIQIATPHNAIIHRPNFTLSYSQLISRPIMAKPQTIWSESSSQKLPSLSANLIQKNDRKKSLVPTFRKDHSYSKYTPMITNDCHTLRPTVVKVVDNEEMQTVSPTNIDSVLVLCNQNSNNLPKFEQLLPENDFSSQVTCEQGQIKVVVLRDSTVISNHLDEELKAKKIDNYSTNQQLSTDINFHNKKIETKQLVNKFLERIKKQHQRNFIDEGPPECKVSTKFLFEVPENSRLSFKSPNKHLATIGYEFEDGHIERAYLYDHSKQCTTYGFNAKLYGDKLESVDADVVLSPERGGVCMQICGYGLKEGERWLAKGLFDMAERYCETFSCETFVYDIYDDGLNDGFYVANDENLIVIAMPDDVEIFTYSRTIHTLKYLAYKLTMDRMINDCLELLQKSKICKDLAIIIINVLYYSLQRCFYIQQLQSSSKIVEQVRYMLLFDYVKVSCVHHIQDMWMEAINVYFDIRFLANDKIHSVFIQESNVHLIQSSINCWQVRNSKRVHVHEPLWPNEEDITKIIGRSYCGRQKRCMQVLINQPNRTNSKVMKFNSFSILTNTLSRIDLKSKPLNRKRFPVELSPPRQKIIKRSARGATPPPPLPPAKRRRVMKAGVPFTSKRMMAERLVSETEAFKNLDSEKIDKNGFFNMMNLKKQAKENQFN